jgi:hypothetical protein
MLAQQMPKRATQAFINPWFAWVNIIADRYKVRFPFSLRFGMALPQLTLIHDLRVSTEFSEVRLVQGVLGSSVRTSKALGVGA